MCITEIQILVGELAIITSFSDIIIYIVNALGGSHVPLHLKEHCTQKKI